MNKFCDIKSKDNSLIKLVSSLQRSSKTRNERNMFVLEGLRISQDAMDCGIKFDKLILSETACIKYKSVIEDFAKNSNAVYRLTDDLFKKISDTVTPQGIIALAEIPKFNNTLIDKNGKYIALENLQDPSNLGAIARSAEALGVSGIIVSRLGCDPYSPKVLRASMGTILRMPIYFFDNFATELKQTGLKSYACVVNTESKNINEFKYGSSTVMVIGNEGNGLTKETISSADYAVTIPMQGKAESLNAAAAAAIAMWEMMK